jgi:hypothetical protein
MSFHQFTGTDTYIASAELRDAVNVAVALEKPLLIKGEPGTGKTRLAEAIAQDLGMPLLTWNVKSTSKAHDGLYVYDTVQRLNDARFGDRDIRDIRRYIKLGALGRAFKTEERVVLLIPTSAAPSTSSTTTATPASPGCAASATAAPTRYGSTPSRGGSGTRRRSASSARSSRCSSSPSTVSPRPSTSSADAVPTSLSAVRWRRPG